MYKKYLLTNRCFVENILSIDVLFTGSFEWIHVGSFTVDYILAVSGAISTRETALKIGSGGVISC